MSSAFSSPKTISAEQSTVLEPGGGSLRTQAESEAITTTNRSSMALPTVFPYYHTEPLCVSSIGAQNNLSDKNQSPGVEGQSTPCRQARLRMIQRHGIGVIHTDEWVSPDPHRCIWLPLTVRMAKVINLRAARKRAARLQDEQRATERRAQFGLPKAERLLAKARTEKARREVDDHRIGNGEGR
jgi:hypothetical protein